jgi:hypothetical protein
MNQKKFMSKNVKNDDDLEQLNNWKGHMKDVYNGL